MTIPQIIDEQDAAITAAVAAFQASLEKVVSAAKAKLQARLHDALVLDAAGNIKRTRANAKVLGKLNDWFMEEMAASGFVHLSREFVNTFPGQLPFFDDIVAALAKESGKQLSFEWTGRDKRAFTDYAEHARLSIEGAVSAVATSARSQILLTFGGLPYKALVALLAEKLDLTVPRAVTMADTALVVFTRTIANQGYKKLEFYFKDIRYQAAGPLDQLNRPFCRKLQAESNGGKTWTRAEIDAMDNGQIPNVFTSFGGFNCRHQWAVTVNSAKAA